MKAQTNNKVSLLALEELEAIVTAYRQSHGVIGVHSSDEVAQSLSA